MYCSLFASLFLIITFRDESSLEIWRNQSFLYIVISRGVSTLKVIKTGSRPIQ